MPEASYDEASRARWRTRTSIPGGSGPGGGERGPRMILICMLVVFACVAARLVYLQVIDASELSAAAQENRTNVVTLHAKRGTIYDRNGNVLAMSVDCKTIYCNPQAVSNPSAIAEILADELGGEVSDYTSTLTSDTTFAYIEKQVDTDIADEIEQRLDDEDLEGVYFLDDTKRVYPYGDVGGQVLGVVGSEGSGITGLEYYYDDVLSGTDGQMTIETGATGTPIAGGVSEIQEAQDGEDIVISIDISIQQKAEEVIPEAAETYNADSGSVVVMNPKTGEIYAMCSTPLAKITDLSNTSSESLQLKPVTSSYEPGSMFKVITVSIGVELGLFDADTVYNVPAALLVGDDYVTDDDGRDYDMDMTVREILRRSSNPGAALLGQEVIGAERFSEGVAKFGIGQLTGLDYPGESTGIVKSLDEYDGSTCGQMSFGQGLAVPMIQIVRAFAAVANDGIPNTPHFLISKGGEEVDWPSGDRIISKETADEVTDMMRTVMTEGTGQNGQVDGYDIAGKTGTGEQASEEGGYAENKYVSSLCGFANADDPSVLVYVGLNGTPYLALSSAAPPFKEIMTEAVSDLGIAPSTSSTSSTSTSE